MILRHSITPSILLLLFVKKKHKIKQNIPKSKSHIYHKPHIRYTWFSVYDAP